MTERITDPEVLADLQLREQTSRDRADRRAPAGLEVGQDLDGLSPAIAALYDSAPDPIVEHWPCRTGCGAMVGVTRDALEALAVNNRKLADRREKLIAKHEVMWCDRCKRRHEELETARRSGRAQTEMPGVEPARSAR